MSTRPLVNLWNDFDSEEAPFQYPYETPAIDIEPKFKDPYCRKPSRLIASISQFCKLIQDEEIHIVNDQDVDIRIFQPLGVTARLYANELSERDFNAFGEVLLRYSTKKSVAINAKVLPQDRNEELHPALANLSQYEEIIFYRSYSEKKWAILRVSISKEKRKNKFTDIVVDGYFLGNVTMSEVEPVTFHLHNILSASFPYGSTVPLVQWRRRVHVPLDFAEDNVFLAYLIVHYLQRNGNYLDISSETILLHKFDFSSTKTLLHYHDAWLGQLQLHKIDSSSYPFVTESYKGEEDLSIVEELGWHVVDVEGDGNCGYYSLLLGLVNIGIMDYYIDTSDKPPVKMTRQNPWRDKVIQLRKDLREHSEEMLENIYTKETRQFPDLMWTLAGILSESDLEGDDEEIGLSKAIAVEEPEKEVDKVVPKKKKKEKPSLYFRHDFKTKFVMYHMNPYWVPHVLASKYKIRVVVYLMLTSHSEPVTWSSVSFEYKNETHNSTDSPHMEVIWNSDAETSTDLSSKRLSDVEFKRVPTIEILYLHSHGQQSGHFQYLQRIICSGVGNKHDPSLTTLREELRVHSDVAHWDDSNPRDALHDATLEAMPPQQAISAKAKVSKKAKVVVRPSGMTSKRKSKNELRRESVEKAQATKMFNNMVMSGELKKPTRMKYNSSEDTFYSYIFVKKDEKKPIKSQPVPKDEINSYHPKLISHARKKPDTWVGPTCEDVIVNTGDAPLELCTKVGCIYQQHNKPYCIIYSFASAVRYCGFNDPATYLHNCAPSFPTKDFDEQIAHLLSVTPPILPLIGGATVYGERTSRRDHKKRVLDWETLFTDLTIYPTIVIPILRETGTCTHAFCVVDDLIFDSTTPCALKLGMDSVRWLFRERETDIHRAYRFNVKVSPSRKNRVEGKYERPMVLHP